MKNSSLVFPIGISIVYILIAGFSWYNFTSGVSANILLTIIALVGISVAWLSYFLDKNNK